MKDELRVTDKKYASINEMLCDSLGEDDPFVEECRRYFDSRKLMQFLTVTRVAANVSQSQFAERLGWDIADVIALEYDLDENITIQQLKSYFQLVKHDDRLRRQFECELMAFLNK